ncbi:MAG: DNA primase [Tissierellia bacterium]|nr:DNA primase [Tissierellia bacterium]
MAVYGEDIVEEIKRAVDIREVIEQYVPLKKRGRNYVGNCPFHMEKTPSFTVSSDKQFFHCFGCGEGGDVIAFIMKKENLNFAEALEVLANKAGISLEKTEASKELNSRKKHFLAINKEAAKYFFKSATKSPVAMEFFQRRGLSIESIRRYGLGYADEKWDSLLLHMKNKGYDLKDLNELDLISEKKDSTGYYDRFRHRIIFPIINHRGEIIGFGGRVLGDGVPKYLNTSDTPVFRKGNELYGLHIVTKLSDRSNIILVEGYMDVIALSQQGFENTAASLGTAFTPEQAKLASRYGQTIYLCYDSDQAGINATKRAIEICNDSGNPVRIIRLDEGMDPDDYIRKYGKTSFKERMNEALRPADYYIHLAIYDYKRLSKNDPTQLLQEIAKQIALVISPVEREVLINRYSELLHFSSVALKSEVEVNMKKIAIAKEGNRKVETNLGIIGQQNLIRQWLLLRQFIREPGLAKLFVEKTDSQIFTNIEFSSFFKELSYDFKAKGDLDTDRYINKLMEMYWQQEGFKEIDPDSLKGPNGEDEISDWILRLENESLVEQRDKLLNVVQNYDRQKQGDYDISQVLLQLEKINRRLSNRKSDDYE